MINVNMSGNYHELRLSGHWHQIRFIQDEIDVKPKF